MGLGVGWPHAVTWEASSSVSRLDADVLLHFARSGQLDGFPSKAHFEHRKSVRGRPQPGHWPTASVLHVPLQ